MIRVFIASVTLLVLFAAPAMADEAAREQIQAALKQLSPHVAPEAERDQLRTMLSRSLRDQIAAANRASSAGWSKIATRDDWQRFRQEKLTALRMAIGPFPPRPAKPRTLVT